MGPGALQAIEPNAIGGRVEGGRHESFHAVRNRIHAGGGGQPGWQAECEFGVANGSLGHQMPGVKAEFAVVIDNDDGATRHFAAGAAGGRHGNQGRDALGNQS